MTVYDTFGTLIKRGDGGSPEVFATIAGVKDISGPDIELRTEESTSHDSPGGWVGRKATLKDGGEPTLKLNWDPGDATHVNLRNDLLTRTLRNFQIIEVDDGNEQANFAAYVTKITRPRPVEGLMEADVTLAISGPVTIS